MAELSCVATLIVVSSALLPLNVMLKTRSLPSVALVSDMLIVGLVLLSSIIPVPITVPWMFPLTVVALISMLSEPS